MAEVALPGILGIIWGPVRYISSVLHCFTCPHLRKLSLEKPSPNLELFSGPWDTQLATQFWLWMLTSCLTTWFLVLVSEFYPYWNEPTIAAQDGRPDSSPWPSTPNPIFSLWCVAAGDCPKFNRCLCVVQNLFLYTVPGDLVWKKQPALADSLVDITRHMRQEEALPTFRFCFCWSLLWFPMKRTILRR